MGTAPFLETSAASSAALRNRRREYQREKALAPPTLCSYNNHAVHRRVMIRALIAVLAGLIELEGENLARLHNIRTQELALHLSHVVDRGVLVYPGDRCARLDLDALRLKRVVSHFYGHRTRVDGDWI